MNSDRLKWIIRSRYFKTLLSAGLLAAGSLSFAQDGDRNFSSQLGGIRDVKFAFNRDSKLTADEQTGVLKISGTPTEKHRSSKYLGAQLVLTEPQDLTSQRLSFEFKGDPGDLFIRAFNKGEQKGCMYFKGYSRVVPSEWRQAELQYKVSFRGFSWAADQVNGVAPTAVDRIEIIYRPAALNKESGLNVRMLKAEEVQEAELKRIVSQDLTVSDVKSAAQVTTLVKNNRSVAKVIVPFGQELTAAEKQALGLLNEHFGVSFSTYALKEGQQTLPAGDYILFGDGVRGPIVNRLLSLLYLNPDVDSFEVRNIRNAFQNGCNILYFGGMKDEKLIEGVQRFIARQSKAGGNLSVGKYVDVEQVSIPEGGHDELCAAAEAQIRAIYVDQANDKKNTDAIRVISNLARTYNNTGDERLVPAFMNLIRIMNENYESSKNWRRTPPSFRAQELAFAVDMMDESESLSDEDLVLCGNLMRQITEDCMNYYEMREPMALYDSKKTGYLTNHPLFASRSVSALGSFLKKRFDIPAADYWIAVSANAYKEIAMADQGPEDAGSYQWLCRRLYNDFAQQSGTVPMVTPNLQGYIDFSIAHFNQMGRTASYGDAIPMEGIGPIHFPIAGYKYYNDSLSAHIIRTAASQADSFVASLIDKLGLPDHPEYEPRMVGLTTFPLCDYLEKYYKLETDALLLNKAVFRSGYEPDDEYMMLGGVNLPHHHGHLDGNAIIEYSSGDRYWLVEGDYIKNSPREHNTVTVSRDAESLDQRRTDPTTTADFAHIEGTASAPDGSAGITATAMHDYNGMDWTRNIFWSSKNGFWIIDQLDARESGRYVIKCIWRTLGDVSVGNDSVQVRQEKTDGSRSPDQLLIARGDSAVTTVTEQFDFGHSGPYGYYDSYPFSGPMTKVITQTRDLDLQKGTQTRYVNFFKTGYQAQPESLQVRKAGASAWIVNGAEQQLVVLDGISSAAVSLKAQRALVSPEGILAIGLSALKIGDETVSLPNGETFFCRFGEGALKNITPDRMKGLLADLYSTSEAVSLQSVEKVDVPELAGDAVIEAPAPIAACAVSDSRIVCGLESGDVAAYDQSGVLVWSTPVGAPVTALCPVKNGDRTFWAVGTRYENRTSETAYVALIADDGTLLWKKPIERFHGRPGTVRDITPAKLLAGNSQQIVAGSEAWKYVAFDLEGNELWSFPVLHAATVCTAADMTGDGLDEVALGTEYYYHWIVSPEGKKLKTVLSTIGDVSVATGDVTGDGKSESIWGRGDAFVKVMRPGDAEKRYVWEANVGGLPTGIAMAPSGDLAVSTDNNAAVFLKRSGEQSGVVRFPEALEGITAANGFLYAACRDGYVYRFTDQGIVGKVAISNFVNNSQTPLLKSMGQQLVVGFDRYITIVK